MVEEEEQESNRYTDPIETAVEFDVDLTGAFQTSREIDRISDALVTALGQIKNAERNQENPHFKYRYADLAAVMDAVRPALYGAGLCAIQGGTSRLRDGDTYVTVTTRILHRSGQWIQNSWSAMARNGGPQEIGSAITYLKRYGISALTGCAADDDDDGERVQQAHRERRSEQGQKRGGQKQNGKGKQNGKQAEKLNTKEVEAIVMAFQSFKISVENLEEKAQKKRAEWTQIERDEFLGIHQQIMKEGLAPEDLFGIDIPEPEAEPAEPQAESAEPQDKTK